MHILQALLFVSFFLSVCSYELPKYLLPKVPDEVQTVAVQKLIQRIVGQDSAHKFQVKVDSKLQFRSFKLLKENEQIFILGSDGVSAAKGFHHYLKYFLHKDINWIRLQVNLSNIVDLPFVNRTSNSASQFIYYQNVCTWSYSFAWWNWPTWRQHIDWMALMGISLTIAPVQEQIWHNIYKEMGMTEQEILQHFSGPAFQAWQRMGNIRGWAGPMPLNYRLTQLSLQKRIIAAQRDLGMTVALPAFAGHVPVAMTRLFPNATYTQVQRWNNFPDQFCCTLFLEPTDELFTSIAQSFLKRMIAAYGSNHIYFADPYNEVDPSNASAAYLKDTATNIYNSMAAVDENAIWLLQGWMFVKNLFWSDELIASFLKATPLGNLLVLDLQSEQFPQYVRTHSYHGQPFIWCMLHNFGGTLGMFGSAEIVNQHIEKARQMANSSMIGVGITPEGIHQNYVMYVLTLERAWSKKTFNLEHWFEWYAQTRYELMDPAPDVVESWQLLRRSVYAFQGLQRMRGKYIITRRPALNLKVSVWYNETDIDEALGLMLQSNITQLLTPSALDVYYHDVVDLTRQWLQLKADHFYVNLRQAYKNQELERLMKISEQLILLFDDLDMLLSTDSRFLLGRWLADAQKLATNKVEFELYSFNARNQITSWGPDGQILDYANKQWSGLVGDYYRPRWQIFTSMLIHSILDKSAFNATQFRIEVSEFIELPFSYKQTVYPTEPLGNSLKVAKAVYKAWTLKLQDAKFRQILPLSIKKTISLQLE